MANFNRKRIPERQPHAKGFGPGALRGDQDVSVYTKAAMFQPGTKTDTLIRFSKVARERGSPDTWCDPRGFALKFYTTAANYDMVGNNTRAFFIREVPLHPLAETSCGQRPPRPRHAVGLLDAVARVGPPNRLVDGDRGIPKKWRHMNGYSSHTSCGSTRQAIDSG